MYWFQKDLKREINGITLEEWVKENVNDTHHITVLQNTEKGYTEVMYAYGVNEIRISNLEPIKNHKVEKVITVIDKKDKSVERYIVLIE